MAKKKAGSKREKGEVPPGGNPEARVGAKLTGAEEDLLWHVEHGYQAGN